MKYSVNHLPNLNAEEQHLIAALLAQHVNSIGSSGENNPLYQLAQRVCDHLDKHGLLNAVEPLPIKSTPNHPYGARLMMHWTLPEPNEPDTVSSASERHSDNFIGSITKA